MECSVNHKILEIALGEYGLKEIQGGEDNPRILEYFASAGHEWVKDDETAWCSAFMNWVANNAGAESTGKLNARSWLAVGEQVIEPKPGDCVIFWREKKDSWKGHIAIYINETADYIYCLGGNQGNKVQISAYPKYRLLGYRRLKQK